MCDMSVSAYARSKINLLSLAEQQARDTFKVLRFFSWLPLTASQVSEEGQTSSSLHSHHPNFGSFYILNIIYILSQLKIVVVVDILFGNISS